VKLYPCFKVVDDEVEKKLEERNFGRESPEQRDSRRKGEEDLRNYKRLKVDAMIRQTNG
jgi:hypothetical protein